MVINPATAESSEENFILRLDARSTMGTDQDLVWGGVHRGRSGKFDVENEDQSWEVEVRAS
jgi:hypothetical protein